MTNDKKRLNLLLPSTLLKMHAKVCIDLGISQTQAFTQYLLCVQEQNEKSGEDNAPIHICFYLKKQKETK